MGNGGMVTGRAERLTLAALTALAALAAMPAELLAQNHPDGADLPQFVVDQWNTDRGLPQNTVNAIAQTRDGYLWLATFGGLARFDGVRFTLFPAREYPGIPSDRIQTLAVDSAGNLWIGTERGLARYDGQSVTGFSRADGLVAGAVTALRTDSRGDVWVAVAGGGLSRFHYGAFRHFGIAEGLTGASVGGIWEDEPGTLFVSGPAGGIRLDLATLHIRKGPGTLPAPGLEHPALRDADGSVWYVQSGAVEVRRHGVATTYGAASGIFGAGNMARDRDGNYLVSTNRGLVYLHAGNPSASARIAVPGGPSDFAVRSVFVDREGTRWAGTDADGLLRLRPKLFTVLTKADGLANDVPVGMLRDRDGRIWVGSNCDRTAVIEHGHIRQYPPTVGCVWALAQAPDGALWMAPYSGGLVRMDGDRIRRYGTADGLSSPLVLAILADSDGTVWAGTSAGLDRLRDGRVTVYDTSAGLPQNDVHMIVRDRAGALWIGTIGGLARMAQGRITAFTTADGLGGDNVRAFYEDAAGTSWIGTYGGGLTRLKDGHFSAIRSDDGLFDDVVSAILEDGRGNLWMAGNRGIFRANLRDLNAFADGVASSVPSVGYGTADGLLSAETNGGFQPSAMKTPDGRLWFPTVKGLAIVDPANATPNPAPPGVVVEAVLEDGRPVAWQSGLSVPAGVQRVEIRFTGLSSPAPEGITFRYRMSGIEDDWVYGGHERVAYYSRLAPGSYHFTVSAANRDGLWNPVGAGFDVRVPPPFWVTWWFRAGLVLLVVGGTLSAVRLRLSQLRAANAAQQEFSRRLIATQESERKRIASELHDSLGQDLLVVKNRAVLALEQSGDADQVREHLRQIGDVITDAIKGTRAIAHDLRPYQLDRLGLGASIRAAVDKSAQASGIHFSVRADGVDGLLGPDAEIALFRIVQEAVNNILKHSGATEATVSAFASGSEVRVVIVDNGRGIGAAAPGFGLSGIAERVTLLGGRHELESEAGQGTTHRIAISLAGRA